MNMEEFKRLDQLMDMDEKHKLMGDICGSVPSLEVMHKYLLDETLNVEVPDEIKSQFNIAKNMAIYSYFFYAIAPEVHLKTYSIIEHALRIKINPKKPMMLKALMIHAVAQGWISDSGFRNIKSPNSDNEWCKSMIDVIPRLRNAKAHGSNMLVGDCLDHISSCADLINQLFPSNQTLNT
jgi:hypothetical protein